MRTTVDIDPELLDEVLKATEEKSRGRALNKVMTEYLRRIKINELREFAKDYPIDDGWREWRDLDLARQKRLDELSEG